MLTHMINGHVEMQLNEIVKSLKAFFDTGIFGGLKRQADNVMAHRVQEITA